MPGAPSLNLLWLQAASCGGCTVSLLEHGGQGPFAPLADFGIRLLWHPGLAADMGEEALALFRACAEGATPLDILVVEGAALRGPGGSGRYQMVAGSGRSMKDWLLALAPRARHVLAVGACAAYGGVPMGGGNAIEACGLHFEAETPGGLLGADFRSGSGLPVINIAGCPPHPDWIVETLMALAVGDLAAADLDRFGRPAAFFSHLAHHGCPRNEFYEFKASAEKPSDLGCLMENLGCKGTQALGDCNIRPWHGTGSCIRGGFPCVGCTTPGFEEPGAPFAVTPKVAGIPVGLPVDMPKAWFVALAALSKSATPARVRKNAVEDHLVVPPAATKGRRT